MVEGEAMLEDSKVVVHANPFNEGVDIAEQVEITEMGVRLGKFVSAWSQDRWAKNIVSRGLSWRWIVRPRIHRLTPQRTSDELWHYVEEMLKMVF